MLRLETVACEVGGRLSIRARALLDICAAAKVRSDPSHRQAFMAKWWCSRWISMLSVGIQTSVCSTLVDDGCLLLDAHDGPEPYEKVWESRDSCVLCENPYPGSGRLNTPTHD